MATFSVFISNIEFRMGALYVYQTLSDVDYRNVGFGKI